MAASDPHAMTPPAAFAVAARSVKALTAIWLWTAGLLFGSAVVGLSLDIVLRYAFGAPLPFMTEAVGVAFNYVTLLGAAALYARNDDIVLEFVYNRLPPRAREWLVLAVHAVIAVTMAVVFVEAVGLMIVRHRLVTPAMLLPQSIQVLPLCLAAASIALTSLIETWSSHIGLKTGHRPRVIVHEIRLANQ